MRPLSQILKGSREPSFKNSLTYTDGVGCVSVTKICFKNESLISLEKQDLNYTLATSGLVGSCAPFAKVILGTAEG